MVKEFLNRANTGEPVYISTVYEAFGNLKDTEKQVMNCVLTLLENNETRLFKINLPVFEGMASEEISFVKSYVWAEIYNILSSLGGKVMDIYVDIDCNYIFDLASELNKVFYIDSQRSQRRGYGRAVNVIDRMLSTLCPNGSGFRFNVYDISKMPEINTEGKKQIKDSSIFTKVTEKLEGKIICGMDVGGTDIKIVLVKDGKIDCYKEYDWFPASFKESNQLIEPICLIVRLIRAKASLDNITDESGVKLVFQKDIQKALDKDASDEFMIEVVEKAEAYLNGKFIEIDAIGLCFPDVVVKDKVVGGEVYKTRGIRNNADIDYEKDFMKLTNLNDRLHELIKTNGAVNIINDGPMASFTAAVENAAIGTLSSVVDGVFAHTLGTELGTGWVDGNGVIPDIPLEVYNFIIDLGSFVEKQYPADDLRSINNFNTELPGTLQKYCSQSGIFRLALKYFNKLRPDLYQELFDKGFVVPREVDGITGFYVPTEPKDQRKPFLEHMMALPERENDEINDRIWRKIGEYLAITWLETEKILNPGTATRVLFGRLVKNRRCFELIREGAKAIKEDILLEVADAGMANTPLMKQLEANTEYTVAQFAQAVGAIYYGNAGLINKEINIMDNKILTVSDIAKMIDHSLLRPNMTIEEIREGCRIAKEYNVASVCVKPTEVEICMEELKGSNVMITTVIGFPHGSNTTEVKVFEAINAIENGCEELDMVLNIGRLVSRDFNFVEKDIKAVVDAAHSKGVTVKVILENAYLTDELKEIACKICDKVGADFVKTSTGYAKSGATIPDLVLMRKNTSSRVKIKAAGGVRTLDNVLSVRAAGVSRFGATATKVILDDAEQRALAGTLYEV